MLKLAKLVPLRNEKILPRTQAVELFGHTTDHSGFLLDDATSRCSSAAISSIFHIQTAQPDINIAFDSDPEQASYTRARLLDQVVSDNLTVSGIHFKPCRYT